MERIDGKRADARGRATSAVVLLVLLLLASVSICGCTDAQEIESVGFILGLGIDIADGGRVRIWVQTAVPSSKPEEAEKQPAWTTSSEGESVWDAMRKLNSRSAKALFRGHIKVLVFSEKYARGGIARALDVLARDGDFRYKSWVVVTSDPIERLFSVQAEHEAVASLHVNDIMLSATRSSTAPLSRFMDLITSLEQPGDQPLLARVSLVKSEPASGESEAGQGANAGQGGASGQEGVEICGSAAFHDDKMVGWLDPEQTAAVLIMRNRLRDYSFTHRMPGREGGTVGVSLSGVRAAIEFPAQASTDPDALRGAEVRIRVRGRVDIREVNSGQQAMSRQSLDELASGLSRQIEENLAQLIHTAQHVLGSDIIGIGEMVRRRVSSRAWDQGISATWHDTFKTLKIVPDVSVEVVKRGMTTSSPVPER